MQLKVGFVGCGTIAAAICTGLNSQTSPVTISHSYVSTRSAAKSAALLAQFGADKITVVDDNQSIVDAADLIFLCVLPQHYEEILQSLTFTPDRHTLVSLVSTSTIAQLVTLSKLPAAHVHKMICLPSVSTHDGTCLLTPKSGAALPLKTILDTLGGCVECESEKIMTAMMIPACLMGPYYKILQNNRDWMIKQVSAESYGRPAFCRPAFRRVPFRRYHGAATIAPINVPLFPDALFCSH